MTTARPYVPLNFTAGSGVLNVRGLVSANLVSRLLHALLVNTSRVRSVASIVQIRGVPDTQAPTVSLTASAPGRAGPASPACPRARATMTPVTGAVTPTDGDALVVALFVDYNFGAGRWGRG